MDELEKLEKFVELIEDIGFIRQDQINFDITKVVRYNYNDDYMIAISFNSVVSDKWSISGLQSLGNYQIIYGKNKQRNFTLNNIDLLKEHFKPYFKSKLRDKKLKELGI